MKSENEGTSARDGNRPARGHRRAAAGSGQSSRPSGAAAAPACAALVLGLLPWRTSPAAAQPARPPAPRPTQGPGAPGATIARRPTDSAVALQPIVLGSPADEARRVADLFSAPADPGILLRSPGSAPAFARGAVPPSAGRRARALMPSVSTVWNSALPFGGNDAALWAGRGWSGIVRGGVALESGPLRLVLLPELVVSQNRAFEFVPSPLAVRSPFSSPWYIADAYSADLPSRFGSQPWRQLSLGQSSVTVTVGGVATGLATENEWWGPGIRNAIVLGNNAEGFPHAFVRPTRPRRTRLGTVDAHYVVGTLTPSTFFDTAGAREYRSFSGFAVTLAPAPLSNLTLGVERSVVASLRTEPSLVLSHAFDALTVWQRDRGPNGRGDQMLGLFARYRRPDDHVEVYGEYVRNGNLGGFRDLIVDPREGQGFTVGLQAARPMTWAARLLRAQVEFTNLEQSVSFRDRGAPRPFYTGLATRGGHTHRGQVLGAWTGPGSQSHWIALDLLDVLGAPVRAGVFVERIRWNNDALYWQFVPNYNQHDVTTRVGVRGAARRPWGDVTAAVSGGTRRNYEFRNGAFAPGGHRTVDVANVTLSVDVTPRW